MTGPQVIKGRYSRGSSSEEIQAALLAEGFDLFPWQDAPGATYAEHSHPHDEFIVVTAGTIVFSTGGSDYRLETGDAFRLPAGTVHSAVNDGSEPVSYFICTRS